MEISLAPLQGFTEFPLRNALHHTIGGIDKYYSPYLKFENDGSLRQKFINDILPENNQNIKLIPQVLVNNSNDFFKFHEQLVEQIVSSCNRGKVNRFIHISALKCSSSAPSAYLRSKAAGENVITRKLNAPTAQHILRPSVIFGNGDSFLTMFAELSKWLPFIPLAMPKAKFQPIFVGDLVQLIMRCVNGSEHRQLIEVCGPKQYELIELVNYASTFGRLRPIVLPIPNWAAHLQAMTFEALNLNLITRDNLASMSLDNTTDLTDGAFQTSIESIAPTYLGKK